MYIVPIPHFWCSYCVRIHLFKSFIVSIQKLSTKRFVNTYTIFIDHYIMFPEHLFLRKFRRVFFFGIKNIKLQLWRTISLLCIM